MCEIGTGFIYRVDGRTDHLSEMWFILYNHIILDKDDFC